MFLKLTNRFGHRMADGEKIAINFDRVISIRSGSGGANLELDGDRMLQFLCYETLDEILALLAGGRE